MKTAQQVLDEHGIQPRWQRSGEQILGLLQEMEPRTVTTLEELNNLPVGAVLKGDSYMHLDVVVKTTGNNYYIMGYVGTYNALNIAKTLLPALVIWEPKP